MAVFCRKLLLCRLKTFILHRIMVIQLFARYSKLTTYVSVAPIPLDIIIYAFFLIWKPWEVYPLFFPCMEAFL